MDWLTQFALQSVLPLLVGPLTYVISEKVQKVTTWFGKQPAMTKQVLTATLATGMTALGQQAAEWFPGGVIALDNLDSQAVATWAVAMATHGIVKARQRKSPPRK